jgi:uncharacterized protein GlcG (DUF336 family)
MKARRFLTIAAAIMGVAVSGTDAAAQGAAPAGGLTLEQAKTAMDAAEAEARQNGWRLTIVVADSAGIPIYLRRLTGATPRSYDIAMAKVRTALGSGMHTADYAAALAAGQTDSIPGGTTFEGGYLIRIGGRIVGAMTASGARGSEDAQAVRAGLAAIGAAP